MKINKIISLASILIMAMPMMAQEESRLMRFPAIYEDQVVFTYAGDLYTVSSGGGMARKLTSHDGFEMFARFSPDGKTIAFTGQYDGNTEVFTIPAEGGEPTRITYTSTLGRDDVGDRMGPNNLVMGWSTDGENIIFRSRKKSFNAFKGHLFTVSKDGGISEQLPFSVAGFCSYSPDGSKIAFNRVFREFRTWKYYQGGMADDIRIFDFNSKTTEIITDSKAQDIFPMWSGNKIYFLSDRDRTMNLFVYDTESKQTSKLTNYTEYDIKFPSLGKNAIIYENGGYLFRFDLASQTTSKISVYINNDMIAARPEMKDVSGSVRSISMSPNAERLVFSARGEVFNVPSEEGITRNITMSPGAHDRNADWSPDGKSIAWISDKDGEFEIYTMEPDNPGSVKALTKNSDTYIFGFEWSPDSKKIAYHDKKFRLWLLDVESGKKKLIDESGQGPIGDYSWSPDSKWIAYVNPVLGMNQISLYNLENSESTLATDDWYQSGSPVFTRNGKFLVFTSSRSFSPTYSQTEWNHIYQDMNKLYLITLAKDTKNPLGPKDDEVEISTEENGSKKNGKENEDDKAKKEGLTVDLDGIQERVIGLPVAAGNYGNIQCLDSKIFYIYGSSGTRGRSLKSFNLESGKETEHGNNFNYLISTNGKKMLLMQGRKYSITGIPGGKASMGEAISLDGLRIKLDKEAEWAQIFDESWRQMRDFFYDPGMHGVDWKAIYKKYQPLVRHAQHRSDLTYIIGEMVGELNVGHAYVNNGERPMPERISTGLLGAVIKPDPSGYFRIEEILPGANWSSELRSPLSELGVNAREGDYIIAVNGNSTRDTDNIYSMLVGQAGNIVELTLSSEPGEENSRKVLVKPISDESSLYYYKWVQANIDKVNRATEGQVGYIHIPDMGVNGLNEFVKHYYPQLTKKALIIDDRGNGGGNVSPMIIERLKREITYATMHTNQKEGQVNPVGTMAGPKIALIDQYSASDGDLFPYRFKHNNIGTVIGVRTWGGVVGYSGAVPCMDGGSIITPSYAPFAADGSGFIIEGYGVEPDIVVDNEPYEEFMGIDRQLDKAIEVIMEQLKNYEKTVPPIPRFPVKNK